MRAFGYQSKGGGPGPPHDDHDAAEAPGPGEDDTPLALREASLACTSDEVTHLVDFMAWVAGEIARRRALGALAPCHFHYVDWSRAHGDGAVDGSDLIIAVGYDAT